MYRQRNMLLSNWNAMIYYRRTLESVWSNFVIVINLLNYVNRNVNDEQTPIRICSFINSTPRGTVETDIRGTDLKKTPKLT